ncbi:MAG: transposase, partial [Burkholderiaceae bacterium]
AGYQGAAKRPESDIAAEWITAMKPGRRRALRDIGTELVGRLIDEHERLTARWRAKVEHPFHVIKNLFRHRKLRYRDLAKNTAQLFSLFGLANLVIAKQSLLALHARAAS